jgi:glycolate oxidase FAD binding subunit
MPNYSVLTPKLERIVGSENIRHSEEGFSDYAVDDKAPRIIVYPDNSDEISAVMRVVNEEGVSVCLLSQGTKIGIGNIPRGVDILLCMCRWGRIIEHDQGNLTVTVEAGVKLSELQKALGDKKQFLPLDPMFGSKSSIGGIVASNSNGPRRLRYGSVRDLLIGMKAVLPTGEKIKAGGKVVKNVAGYDMCKLFVGSLGTLGIITEATFKLYPLPEVQKTILLSLESSSRAFELVSSLLDSLVFPSALEVLNYSALDVLSSRIDISFRENPCCLAVRLEGFKESVQRGYDEIRKMGIVCTRILEGQVQEKFWTELSEFHYISGSNFRFKASVPASITPDVFDIVEEYSKNLGFNANLISHAGNGILYGFFSTGEPDKVIQFMNDLGSYTAKAGGYFVVESAPTEIKKRINIWGHIPDGIKIMRNIKERFDPKDVMSPGRFYT